MLTFISGTNVNEALHKALNTFVSTIKTISVPNAFALLVSFVIRHNREVLKNPAPYFDSKKMASIKNDTFVRLEDGCGFLTKGTLKVLKDGSDQIDLDFEDIKPIDIVVNNVQKLMNIKTAFEGLKSLNAEDVLINCPYFKHQKLQELVYDKDPLFEKRIIDFQCKQTEESFSTLKDAIVSGCQLLKPSESKVDKRKDIQGIVDSLGIVVVIVTDHLKCPLLTITPFKIDCDTHVTILKQESKYTICEVNVKEAFDANKNETPQESLGLGCTCGKKKSRNVPCLQCKCQKNSVSCGLNCRCLGCKNPFGSKPFKQFCSCNGGCNGRRCPCFQSDKMCSIESG